MEHGSERDFFISYTKQDRAWARWIAAQLTSAGHSVLYQDDGFRPGNDFLHLMHHAVGPGTRTIAVMSEAYFTAKWTESEWRSAYSRDPDGALGLLIPVMASECSLPGLLSSRIYIDLVGLDEDAARAELLAGIGSARQAGAVDPDAEHPPFPVRTPSAVPTEDSDDGSASRGGGRSGPRPVNPHQGPGAAQWERLNPQRPRIPDLLGDAPPLVGHRRLLDELRARLEGSDTATLILLSGPRGSGKSAVVRWLKQVAGDRVVDAADAISTLPRQLQRDGSDVGLLLRELQPAVSAAGDTAILVLDDVDRHLDEEGITPLVRDAIAQLDLGFLVLCTRAPQTPQLFPIPPTPLTLDRRGADADEFDQYLDALLDAMGEASDALSADLRRSLYAMSEETPDFRAVEYVVEMLLAHFELTGASPDSLVLKDLLDTDPRLRRMHLPAVTVLNGTRLSFRRKDKSELLAGVLVRRFATPAELAATAGDRLRAFDAPSFLDEYESFFEAAMSLCLTYSPREVVGLLEPDDIRHEISQLDLDPAQRFTRDEQQADLLIRALGFTLVDTPRGLNDFKDSVEDSRALVDDVDARTDVINGAADAVIRHVESALRDLLHFWGAYQWGSVREVVRRFNLGEVDAAPMDVRRLTIAQVVELLRFLNRSAAAEDSLFRISFPDRDVPVPERMLAACDEFGRRAERFVRVTEPEALTAPASRRLKVQCMGVVDAAAAVLAASEQSFPSVIKLSEIVFDEYSRKIFRGIDSDDNDVRFALTDNDSRDELVVAAHYFMLPKRRVSVNPYIVPRGGGRRVAHFDRAREYAQASRTQQAQGQRLLDLVQLRPDDLVLEVGSGTGALAISLAGRVSEIVGIDLSPEMVQLAEQEALDAGVTNVRFQTVDLLEYVAPHPFDVVLSNSAMHWIVPPDRAYQQLYRALRRGGRMAVHQGGYGSYRGLHQFTRTLIGELGYGEYYQGWKLPIYYPTRHDYQELLERVGFVDVAVTSVPTDGTEYPALVQDFAEASLLPYLDRLPEVQRSSFRAQWLEEAAHRQLDLFTHRLYATAVRP